MTEKRWVPEREIFFEIFVAIGREVG